MRSLGGFVLLAGIGVGLFVYFPAPVDSGTTLEQAKRAVASRIERAATLASASSQTAATSQAATTSRLAAFSPGTPLTTARISTNRQARPAPVVTAAAPQPVAVTAPDAAQGWQTAVVVAPTSVMPVAAGPLDPNDADSRYKLVVDIQQHLKRLGCYWGHVNGAWNANTRDAMRSFTDRVNATLPIENPDYVLLTLLQAHNGRTCGECPAGEVLSGGGRCVPQAIVAQAHRKDEPKVAATATPEVLPWKAASAGGAQPATARLFTPVPTSVVSSEPLPGRMAIGGPKEFPPLDPAGQSAVVPGTAPGQPGVAMTALPPGGFPPVAPAAAAPKSEKAQAYKKSYSRGGAPGTPRYNLMLSLGGVY
jgi:hypothetical protein